MTYTDTLDAYVRHLTARGLSPATIALRRSFVRRWAASADGDDVLDTMTTWLADHPAWSPQTRASAAASLRSWLRWARRTGIGAPDPSLIDVPRVPTRTARPIPDDAILTALTYCDDTTAAMILLGREAGLRRAEIAQVHTDDLTGDALIVHGKGGKDRTVPLSPMLVDALSRRPRGWLFPNPDDPTRHLTPRNVGAAISRALPSATAHQLRHTFATRAYQSTRDILAVSRLLGHASVSTTQGYVGVPDESLAAAVAAATLPRQSDSGLAA